MHINMQMYIYACVDIHTCIHNVYIYKWQLLFFQKTNKHYFMPFFESTLLNNANPCRNCTLQRFEGVAEKKERNGTNKLSDTRQDLNPGPRLVSPTKLRCQPAEPKH